MPKIAARYAPNDDRWWVETEELGSKERQARMKEIQLAWDYYEGKQRMPLKVKRGKPDFNVLINLVGEAIDQMVAFLGMPRFEVPGGVDRVRDAFGFLTTVKSPQQQALEDWWRGQEFEIFLTDLYLSGFISGHSYVKLIPGTTLDAELLDPQMMTVFWDNARRKGCELFYRMKWMDGDFVRVQDIVPDWLWTPNEGDANALARLDTQRWFVVEYAGRSERRMERVGLDEWLHPFAPVIDWKNAPRPFQFYGRGDLRPRLNDSYNMVASNLNKIIYHHAGPQTVITGGGLADDQEAGPGTVIDDLPEGAKVYNLEMQSDLSNAMSFLNLLRSSLFSEVRVVDKTSIKDKLGQITNFGVRMLYSDQLDAAYLKHLLYGSGLAEVTRRALLVMGADVERVDSIWEDPLPTNRKELVEGVKVERDMGMTSEQTLLEDLGRDPEVEAERKAEEGEREDAAVAGRLEAIAQRGLL